MMLDTETLGSDIFPQKSGRTSDLSLRSLSFLFFADWLSGLAWLQRFAKQIRAEEGWRLVVRGVSTHCDILPER